MSVTPLPPADAIYSVSRLNSEVRLLLEGKLPMVWVMGEISNFSQPSSGHWYFTLKDAQAQVRCAMFRNRNQGLGLRPQNGLQVQVRVRVSLYEPRGEFQLVAEHMQPAGEGALRLAFEALKARLAAEGLFDSSRKRPLPPYPHSIGVITSPTGAALRDILHVLNRRYPLARIVLYPVPVQGADAAPQIVRALQLAGTRKECDVLILARGGGSLEDLWAFNEEIIARAIRICPLPVVSGIGHEIDFTIADFAADLRAPTPSAAAESITPDMSDLLHRSSKTWQRLSMLARHRLERSRLRLDQLTHRLAQCHPEQRLQHQRQRLDEWEARLQRSVGHGLESARYRLASARSHLWAERPHLRLKHAQKRLEHIQHALDRSVARHFITRSQQLAALGRALAAVSPLGTLERGYAIVRKLPDQRVITDAAQVPVGTRLRVHLSQGQLVCRVEETANV